MRVGSVRIARRPKGFTLPVVLIVLALLALSTAAAGPTWMHTMQREREQELLRIGAEYARAIEQYHRLSPGSLRECPSNLQDLLVDPRHFGLVRHLRRLYPDPVNDGRPLEAIRGASGQVIGIRSASSKPPLARDPVDPDGRRLGAAQRYSDWRFLARSCSQ